MPDISATSVLVNVGDSVIRVHNVDPLKLNDLLYAAPEPPPNPQFGGLRTTSANVIYLFEALPTANWHDPHQRLLEARTLRLIARLRKEEPGAYEEYFPFKVKPYTYQLKLFTHARRMKNIALAPVALGTGKTKMALDVAAAKFIEKEIDGLMIIAPNGVHRQWIEAAIPQHLSDTVRRKAAVWATGRKTPDHVMQPVDHGDGSRTLRILSFNVEAFSRKESPALVEAKRFLRSGKIMLVCDESSRLKSPKAKRTKHIVGIRHLAEVRMILTGTPVTKGLEDFYSQYEFLDPAIIGFSSPITFRDRYCILAPAFRGAGIGQVSIIGYKNQEELIRKIAPVSFMIPKDVLGLPPQRWERVNVEMTSEQRDIYEMLKDQLIEDLRTKKIPNPANAAVRLIRLQQVLCGRYFERQPDPEDPDEWLETPRDVPSNRIAALMNVLEEHDGQAVIWARFTQDILDIEKALLEAGRTCATYYGATKDKDRAEAVRAFRDGEIDNIILNQAAGGTGIDGLQVSSLALYYSNNFNSENRWQSEGRVHRIGTTAPVLYLDFVVPNSVDGLILDNLKKKSSIAQQIFNHPAMLSGGT